MTRKPPKVISPSDPSSAWTAKVNKRVQFGYGLNYLIDVEHAIIVDVEATPARTYDEVASTKMMIERTERRLDLKPDWLTADTAYGTGKLLAWLLGKSITPHIPVWERYPSSDSMFSRSEFTYDAERIPDRGAGDDSPLRTSFRRANPGTSPTRRLSTQRLRPRGLNATSQTRSQPCVCA